MPNSRTPTYKYNPAGDAKVREQRRTAENETEEKNKQITPFMFQGFGFRAQYRAFRGGMNLEGPLCPREDIKSNPCLSTLTGEFDKTKVACDVCGFSADLPQPMQRFKEIAHKKYEGHLRFTESGGKIETLDVPYEAIKEKSEDETRIIKIKWSQKDGRNMAVIYFIEKNSNGEKTQIMVDMDKEEIRYDASDIPPGKILAMVQAVFPNTKVEISY
jgi:hypothetical protein